MRCHHRQERTGAAADVTPVRANRVAGTAVELLVEVLGQIRSRPESNSVTFGEWRHELHGVMEGCSRSISCNNITEARVVLERAFW